MKKSNGELRNSLQECPHQGTRWQHYKTRDIYRVIGCAIAEATQEPLVIYQGGADIPFARPLTEFLEILPDGVPRFEIVPG